MPNADGGGRLARPLPFLPSPLFEPRRPLLAIGVGWLTAFLPSMALAAIASQLFPAAPQPQFEVSGLAAILALVVFAPVVETLIMAAALVVLQLFLRPVHAVLASAAGWGFAHSLIAPTWGLVIWWPFLIFSILFVTWRRRSLLLALAIPAAVHGLQNLLPAMAIASGNA